MNAAQIQRFEMMLSEILKRQGELEREVLLLRDDDVLPWPEPEGGGASFSGTAYIRGVKTTGLMSNASYPWIKVDVAAGTAVEDAGPPPDPFPDGVEYYLKAQTFGDLHVSRFG